MNKVGPGRPPAESVLGQQLRANGLNRGVPQPAVLRTRQAGPPIVCHDAPGPIRAPSCKCGRATNRDRRLPSGVRPLPCIPEPGMPALGQSHGVWSKALPRRRGKRQCFPRESSEFPGAGQAQQRWRACHDGSTRALQSSWRGPPSQALGARWRPVVGRQGSPAGV